MALVFSQRISGNRFLRGRQDPHRGVGGGCWCGRWGWMKRVSPERGEGAGCCRSIVSSVAGKVGRGKGIVGGALRGGVGWAFGKPPPRVGGGWRPGRSRHGWRVGWAVGKPLPRVGGGMRPRRSRHGVGIRLGGWETAATGGRRLATGTVTPRVGGGMRPRRSRHGYWRASQRAVIMRREPRMRRPQCSLPATPPKRTSQRTAMTPREE